MEISVRFHFHVGKPIRQRFNEVLICKILGRRKLNTVVSSLGKGKACAHFIELKSR